MAMDVLCERVLSDLKTKEMTSLGLSKDLNHIFFHISDFLDTILRVKNNWIKLVGATSHDYASSDNCQHCGTSIVESYGCAHCWQTLQVQALLNKDAICFISDLINKKFRGYYDNV